LVCSALPLHDALPISKVVLAKFKKQKVVGQRYKSAQIFPLSGTQMAFLDDYTMLFGDMPAIKAALDARNGDAPSLGSNAKVSDRSEEHTSELQSRSDL